jgi:hypothetical protein
VQAFTLNFWEAYTYKGEGEDGFSPSLDVYVLKSEKPRSGYRFSPAQATSNAPPGRRRPLLYVSMPRVHTFVLWYSCTPRLHPIPLLDCTRAFTIIRGNAEKWALDPVRLGMMGFSVGGHLALSPTGSPLITFWGQIPAPPC